MNSMRQVAINEALFWLHAAIILGGLLMGLVLPWFIAIGLVILHRIHLRVFDGCVVSHWQKKSGDLENNKNYLQQMFQRLFGLEISPEQAKTVDRGLAFSSIAITAISSFATIVVWKISVVFLCFLAIYTCFRILASKTKDLCQENTCAVVTQGNYSSIGGIRLEAIGLIFFLFIAGLQAVAILTNLSGINNLTLMLVSLGLLFSVGLIWIQFAVIKDVCKLCMNIHACSLSIFTLSFISVM